MALLELSFENQEASLDVREFSVRERLSRPFEVSILALSANDDIDLEGIVGKGGTFLVRGPLLADPRAWTGIVSSFEQVKVETTGLSAYRIQIVPVFWLTTKRRRTRIFEHRTIPEIAQQILGEYMIEPVLRVQEKHEAHEYRVQYDESDYDFLSRLFEEEGITYSFVQRAEGDGFITDTVLADRPQSADPRSNKPRYVDRPNPESEEEYVTDVRLTHQVRPGKVTIRDFDFVRPDFVLAGKTEPMKGLEGEYEQYHYVPSANIKDREGKPRAVGLEEAKRRADIEVQSLRASKREVNFESNALDLAPGTVFSIDRHPRKDLGDALLVTEAVLRGAVTGEWVLDGAAVFASVPYRPKQETPKPVVHGVESAIVVGPRNDGGSPGEPGSAPNPPGQEIYTDDFGRVRVQFHWDRDGIYDENASCWVRVSQGWAGSAWGMIMLPRMGQEVLIDFFEGDPDQPIVVGRVYNNRTKVPYKLPDQKTVSTWKSNSSPSSDGFNEIMFDDKAGAELLFVQGQLDLVKLVKVNETERTGADRLNVVGANRTAFITTNESATIGQRWTLATVAPKDLKVLQLADPDIGPQPTFVEMVNEKIVLTTGKVTSLLDKKDINLLADGDVIVKSGGSVIIEGGPKVFINCQPVGGGAPDDDLKLADVARKPIGRVLDAVKAVFSLSPEEQARRKALAMIAEAQRSLDRWNEADRAHFRQWFGTDSEEARDEMRQRLTRSQRVLEDAPLQRDDAAGADIQAYVYPDDATHTIYLGPAFYSAPLTGPNSRAGTLVHEASHFTDVAGTDDFVYGQPQAQALASSDPTRAFANADNVSYWIENMPP